MYKCLILLHSNMIEKSFRSMSGNYRWWAPPSENFHGRYYRMNIPSIIGS